MIDETDPAKKYAESIDPQHEAAMGLVVHAVSMIRLVEGHLRKLDKAEVNSHSVMHIVNPTLYRDMIHSEAFAAQMKLVRAALRFLDEVEQLRAEE